MIAKDATSGWNTEYGFSGDEAIWKIVQQANGAYSITNFVTKKYLGTDDIIEDSRLYDDKGFVTDAVAKPFSEWLLLSVTDATDENNSELTGVSLSGGLLKQGFNPTTTSYDVYVPLDATEITITATAKSDLAFISNNAAILSATSPTAVISCASGNGSSTTDYTFNYVQLGFSDWAARGETNPAKSIPSQWGWKCANANWIGANSNAGGTVRYMDSPAGLYTLGDTLGTGLNTDTIPYKGRIMYTHWSGTVGLTGVYSYPVKLKGAVSYTFAGKYEWDSSNPDNVESSTFTFGINTAADNTGDPVASNDYVVASTDMKHIHDATFTFTPSNDGIYYLTIKNNTAIWGAVSELSITETTGLSKNNLSDIFANVVDNSVNVHGVNAGDKVKVYNANGQLIKQLEAQTNVCSIKLNTGLYIIRVNDAVLKVVK